MKVRHIFALVVMHGEEFFDKTELIEILIWWIIDVIFLGLLSKSLGDNQLLGTLMIVSVITIRPTSVRLPIMMARLIGNDLAGRMFLSIFATSITHLEWIIGNMITTFLQAIMRLFLGYILIYLFFGINILNLGWALFITLPFFIISGWVFGWFTSALVYIVGKRCVSLIHVISFSFIALCGVVSPVNVLPQSLQHISWGIPITYVLTGFREHLLAGASLWPFLLKNLILNGLYAFFTLPFLYCAFRYAKRQGLAHLEDK